MARSYFKGGKPKGTGLKKVYDIKDFDKDFGVRQAMITFSLFDLYGNPKGAMQTVQGVTVPVFPHFRELVFLAVSFQFKEIPTIRKAEIINNHFIITMRNSGQPNLMGLGLPAGIENICSIAVAKENTFRMTVTPDEFYYDPKIAKKKGPFRCNPNLFFLAEDYLLNPKKNPDLGDFLLSFSQAAYFIPGLVTSSGVYRRWENEPDLKRFVGDFKALLAGATGVHRDPQNSFNVGLLGL